VRFSYKNNTRTQLMGLCIWRDKFFKPKLKTVPSLTRRLIIA